MNKNFTKLFNKLATDTELFKKFSEQQNLDDLYKFSLSIAGGYSMEDFKSLLNHIAKFYSNHQGNIQKISPGELELVAGGLNLFDPKKLKSLILTSLLVSGGINGAEILSGSSSAYASTVNDNLVNQNQNTDNDESWINQNTDSSDNLIEQNQNTDNNINSNLQTEILITATPTASTITYGQKLSKSHLLGGTANVPGSFDWVDPNIELDTVGEHICLAKFTPNDNNLSKKTLKIKVKVNKASPKITKKPKAKSITYGEALCNSALNGGSASVPGSFVWENANKYLDAGFDQYTDVTFIPDDEENYEKVNLSIPIDVKKAPTLVVTSPVASPITYGQPLCASTIYNLTMSTPGSIEWDSANTKLAAGNHMCSIIFTPFSNNYQSKKIYVNVTVNKAIPTLDQNNFIQPYKPNIVVSDFKLPDGWRWQNPNMRLDSVGKFRINAIHDETSNYGYRSETIFIEITKAEPQPPSYNIVYKPNGRLRDIRLPVGWHWVDENEIPINSKKYYKASFNADEAGTPFYYSKNSIDIPVSVEKAVPKVSAWARQCTDIIYGTDLTTVPLDGGISEVPGKFSIARPYLELRAGEHVCRVIFTPTDPNYSSIQGTTPIKILKNMVPSKAPELPNATRTDHSISFDISSLGSEVEFSKDNGTNWQSSPIFSNLSPNTPYHFNIRYKENDSRCTGLTSQAVQIFTKASSPGAPQAPVIKSRTRNKIFLEKNNKLEFSIDNGENWQSSPEFTDLKRNTTYSIISRLKETDNAMASVPSRPTKTKTNRFPRPISWIFG